MNNTSLEAAAAAVQHPQGRRVTLDFIESRVKDTRFYHDGSLTIAVVEHVNGFKAVGISAAADPKNYNRELGEKAARSRAINELWKVEGFLLREELVKETGSPAEDHLDLATVRRALEKAGVAVGQNMTGPVEIIHGDTVMARTTTYETLDDLVKTVKDRFNFVYPYELDTQRNTFRFGVRQANSYADSLGGEIPGGRLYNDDGSKNGWVGNEWLPVTPPKV